MAVTAFLSFGSGVEGESTQKGHENWIELQSWSWTVDAASSWTKGGGASVGKPKPGALVWEHHWDSASIELFRAIWTGRILAAAELHVVRSGDGAGTPFLVAKLTDVLITEIATAQAGADGVVQTVAMVFRTVSFEYRRQDAKGGLKAPQAVAWDLAAGTVSPANTAPPAAPASPGTPDPSPLPRAGRVLDPGGREPPIH